MYKISYLQSARQDMINIVTYISNQLQNQKAATELAELLVESIEGLTSFPYANPIYQPIRPLTKEYRKLRVKHYLVFYWIEEQTKTITVARVLYARRNFTDLIK